MTEKIRYPHLFRAFSWALLAAGLVPLVLLTRTTPPQNWLPLAVFIPLVLIADRFAIQMPGNVILSLETTFHLACALIFGPLMAAWVAGVSALISEIALFRRSPDFVARTIGMYIVMWLVGGAVYNALGGPIPLTRLKGPGLGHALLLFLVVTGTNCGIMAVDSLLRGTSFSTYILQVAPRIVVFKTAFAPFGIVGAVAYTAFGPIGSLFFALGLLTALAVLWGFQQASEQLQQRVTTLNLLNEIGQMISSSLELEPLLNLIHEGISRFMDTTNFWIVLYDRERGELCYEVIYDEGQKYPPERLPYDPTRFLAAYVIERREPLFLSTLEEVQKVPIYLETTGSGRSPESLIAVPLLSRGRAIGAISVQSYEPRAFRREDLETLLMVATQAGVALENAHLFQEVEASQQYLRAVLDSVDYAVMVTDLSGRVQLANRATENVFGIQEQDIIHRPLAEVIRHQSLREIAGRITQGAVTGRESIQVSLSDDRIMATQVAPVTDSQGERVGYVLAMADVTPLHRLSQLKSQVIRIASHDLRNPLQLASGFFHILLEELPPLTELQANLARRVTHHLKAMEQLIDELLELERIEVSGERQEELLDMAQLVQQAASEYRWQADMKGLRLWTEIIQDISPVRGNRRMLLQAIGNLLDNAIKYTPEGGTITLRLWEENGEVILTVQDTGVGIPPEALPHVFEHFYRARQPGTEHISGTGLGLSLVQSIIREHHGRVWVESEGVPGKGSLFGIALPAAGKQAEHPPADLPDRENMVQ
ncbi:MAG: GAF domain-containing protein [Thermoflexales bacterium]|nr:GAF domain-containing protein [Thermoflexales bacterium]